MAATPRPTFDTEIITELDGLVTIDEAAEMLGRAGARVRQMVQANNFRRVWALGARPTYLLDRTEVADMAAADRTPEGAPA